MRFGSKRYLNILKYYICIYIYIYIYCYNILQLQRNPLYDRFCIDIDDF